MGARLKRAGTGIAVAAILSLCVAAAAAASAGPVDRAFPGGRINQLAINDGPTEGSFADAAYEYSGCGAAAHEVACTWQVDVGLAPDGFELCPSNREALATIWTSGEQSANGAVASGPRSFVLRGIPGQLLCVVLDRTSTSEWEGWRSTVRESTVLDAVVMGPELISPIEALERRIAAASPPAQTEPPPIPPAIVVNPDCRTLSIGNVSYVFAYRQMGCWKARNLATMAHLSRAAPNGYRCTAKEGGGKRCWRQGHAKKYFEWHPPRGRRAAASR
jgi:hypothetical protein